MNSCWVEVKPRKKGPPFKNKDVPVINPMKSLFQGVNWDRFEKLSDDPMAYSQHTFHGLAVWAVVDLDNKIFGVYYKSIGVGSVNFHRSFDTLEQYCLADPSCPKGWGK